MFKKSSSSRENLAVRENNFWSDVLLFVAIIIATVLFLVYDTHPAEGAEKALPNTFTPSQVIQIGNVLVCDTKEQLELILKTHKEKGLKEAQAVYRSLELTPSPSGGSACAIIPQIIYIIVVERVSVFRKLDYGEGPKTMFVVKITNITQNFTFYMLSDWDVYKSLPKLPGRPV